MCLICSVSLKKKWLTLNEMVPSVRQRRYETVAGCGFRVVRVFVQLERNLSDILVDVTVTHPATTSKIMNNHTDTKKGEAAHMSEMSKKRDYLQKAKENDQHFMPLAVE